MRIRSDVRTHQLSRTAILLLPSLPAYSIPLSRRQFNRYSPVEGASCRPHYFCNCAQFNGHKNKRKFFLKRYTFVRRLS